MSVAMMKAAMSVLDEFKDTSEIDAKALLRAIVAAKLTANTADLEEATAIECVGSALWARLVWWSEDEPPAARCVGAQPILAFVAVVSALNAALNATSAIDELRDGDQWIAGSSEAVRVLEKLERKP